MVAVQEPASMRQRHQPRLTACMRHSADPRLTQTPQLRQILHCRLRPWQVERQLRVAECINRVDDSGVFVPGATTSGVTLETYHVTRVTAAVPTHSLLYN